MCLAVVQDLSLSKHLDRIFWNCFLSERKQFVELNNEGLPHRGFPVGCLKALFLVLYFLSCTLMIWTSASMLDAILFADDTNLFISHNDPVYLINTLNRELNKLSTWFAANRLSLNLSKTNFMVFKPWQKRQSFEFQVSVNEQPILRVSETMFLGVFLDDNLTWKPHISLLWPSKLSKSTGIIHKSRFFLSTQSLGTLYDSVILPLFSHTSILYFHSILILLQFSLG